MSTFFIAATDETDSTTQLHAGRGEGGTAAPDQDNDRIQSYRIERLRGIDSDRRRPIDGCSWRAVAAECHVEPGR
jgi:hypothetical protein